MINDTRILHLKKEIARLEKDLEIIDKIQEELKKPEPLKRQNQSNIFIA